MSKKMKTVLSLSLCIVIALSGGLLSSCGAEEEKAEDTLQTDVQSVEDETTKAAQELQKALDDAKEDATKAENVTKEKIDEAVTYIDENIEKPAEEQTSEIKGKLAYYSAFLKNAADHAGISAEHEISKLGETVMNYASTAYMDTENKAAEEIETFKTDSKEALDKVKEDKDKLVEDFHDLYEKAVKE